jgi:CHAT domain-containing protein
LKENINYNLHGFPKNSYNYYDFDSVIYLFLVEEKISFYRIKADSVFQYQYDQFLSTFNLNWIKNDFWGNFRVFAESSYYLFSKLIPKISEEMLIIPEGRLYYIPFEALITEFPDTTKYPYYKYFPYLLNKTNIRYDFVLREHIKSKHKMSITAIAPDINLDYAVKEVKRLKRYGARVYIGNKAKINNIFDGDILHIASHYNPYEKKIHFTDRALNIDEMKNLNKELTTLSTCYSGDGTSYLGEGTFSASRSFYLAGSRSVIESLWLNTDVSSYMLFSSFYKELGKGKNKSNALTISKRQYLKDCLHYMSHPYFWANVRFFGNNYPVDLRNLRKIYLISGMLIIIMLFYYFKGIRRK